MIHVETVDLSLRNVRLPNDRVGMVVAQPYLPNASLTPAEPYQCTDEARPQQLATLRETLGVARAANHGAAKTHFTVFPEYSIPGLDGVALIESAIQANDWPNGTIIIGGTDGLRQAQYAQLLEGNTTHVDAARNGIGRVGPHLWVNCAITWIKSEDGVVERWIQPKLYPAWDEMNVEHQYMFRGSSVYVFKGLLTNDAPFRFGTLVCFDWIATVGSRTPCQWILADLQQQANGNQLPLSWLFIIQRNKKPSHDTFLNAVHSFFNQTQFPNALRDRACIVFANTAGKAVPGRVPDFGGCSAVLSPQSLFATPSSLPTFSTGGAKFRDGSNLLSSYKDFFFRERGACIHSFAQINPGSLIAGPAGRTVAVEQAYVCPISGTEEPRAPNAPVPASIKWLNDELDEIPTLSATYPDAALVGQVDTAHAQNIADLRKTPSQGVMEAIKLAAQESTVSREDDWALTESEALRHLVHTVDILRVGLPTRTVGVGPAHATMEINQQPFDVLAIRGTSHENCIEHSKLFLPRPRRRVLLISRDPDNTPWQKKFGSFLDSVTARPGKESKITDPSNGSLHLGYQNLLGIFRGAASVEAVAGGINAELTA